MHFAVNVRQREIGRLQRVQTIAMRIARLAEKPQCVRVVMRDRLSEMPRERPEVKRLIRSHKFVFAARRNWYANLALANPFRLELPTGCAMHIVKRQPQVIALRRRAPDL